MEAVLEQVSKEQVESSLLPDHIRTMTLSSLQSGQLSQLRTELEQQWKNVAGPVAVKPIAEAFAKGLSEHAAHLAEHAPHQAMQLYLKAARALSQLVHDRLTAAQMVAKAWQVFPDAHIPTAAQSLLTGTQTAPTYALYALSEVGEAQQRQEALRRLASDALENGHLHEALQAYERLLSLLPEDKEALFGHQASLALVQAAQTEKARLEASLAESNERERAEALYLLANYETQLGEEEAALAHHWEAIALGWLDSQRALEHHYRQQGDVVALEALYRRLLQVSPPTRQPHLRRKLFVLLDSELGRPEEARPLLSSASQFTHPDAPTGLAEAHHQLASAQTPLELAQASEELALLLNSPSERLAIFRQAARALSALPDPKSPAILVSLERLWRRTLSLSRHDDEALQWLRSYYTHTHQSERLCEVLERLLQHVDTPEQRQELTSALALEVQSLVLRPLASTPTGALADTQPVEEALAKAPETSLQRAVSAYRQLEQSLLVDLEATKQPSEKLKETWGLLRQLYLRMGQWPALAALLETWFEFESDPDYAQALGHELLGYLTRPEQFPMPPLALRITQVLLARQPQQQDLALALEERLIQLSAWEALANLHEQRLTSELPAEEQARLLRALSDLYLEQLHLPWAARSALERWYALQPDETAPARRLYQLYRDTNELDAALRLVTEIAPKAKGGSDDLRLQVGLAQLSELQGQVNQARQAWIYVQQLSPEHPEAQEALTRLGTPDEALETQLASLQQRLQAASGKTQRLPLHIELAEIYLIRMEDFAQALPHLQVIAESTNSSSTARRFFQRTLISQQRWDKLRESYTSATEGPRWRDYIQLLKEASKQVTRGPALGALNQETGRIYDLLEDPRGALEHYETALREDPNLLESARRYWLLTQEHPHLTRRPGPVEALARQSNDLSERLMATMALGTLYRRAKDATRAADAWGRALVLAARIPSAQDLDQALSHLIEDASATGRWELTKNALETALYHLNPTHNELRVSLHLALGTIARTRLLDAEEAIRHYQWALELKPGHKVALDELEALYFSNNNFNGLESIYRARLAAASSDETRIEALGNLARFAEDVLLDAAKTAAIRRELLIYKPEDKDLCEGLIRSYEQLESHQELADLLELSLLHLDDAQARDQVQRRLVHLWAETLKSPYAALPHISALIERAPIEQLGELIALLQRLARQTDLQFETELPLERAYRRAQALRPLFNLLESRLNRIQEGYHEQRVALLDELSLLAEGALRQPERAFDFLVRRFELAPDDPELWPELERLSQLSRQFDTLAELWQKLLNTTPSPLTGERKVALQLRLGEIYHRRLLDLDAAIAVIEQAYNDSQNPDFKFHALEHLEILHKQSADLESFARVKLLAAEQARSLTLKRSKIVEAADALAGALGRPEEALALLEPLWREDLHHHEFSKMLFSISERSGDVRRTEGYLTELIEHTEQGTTRDQLLSQRAQLRLDKLGAWEEAIADFMSLVDSAEAGKHARATLLDIARAEEASAQRLDIVEFLLNYYREHAQNEGLVNTLLVAAEFEDDPQARAQLFRQAAEHALPALTADDETLKEAFVTNEDEASHAFDLLLQGLLASPSDEGLHLLTKRASLLSDRTIDYLETLESAGEELLPELSQLSNISLETAELARQLAQREAIFSLELGEVARAQKALRRELAIAEGRGLEDTLDSLERLLALSIELNSSEDQMHALSQLAKRRLNADERAQAQLQLAQLARAQGNADAEELSLRDALYEAHSADDQEGAARILSELEGLYIARNKLGDLISLLQERAQLSFSPDERRSTLLRAVEVAQVHMHDRALATRLLDGLISQEPNDRELLAKLSTLQAEQGLYEDQIQTLYRLEELSVSEGQHDQAQSILLEIARLHLEALHQPEDALAVYVKLLEADPQHPQARIALEALEVREPSLVEPIRRALTAALKRELQQNPEGDWSHLASLWERELASDLHLETALSLAELYLTRLQRPDEAVSLLLRAYEFGDVRDSLRQTAHERLLEALPQASTTLRPALSAGLVRVAEELSSHDGLVRLREDLSRLDALNFGQADVAPLLRALSTFEPPEQKAALRLAAWARSEGNKTDLRIALEALAQQEQTPARHQAQLELAALLHELEPEDERAVQLYRELLSYPEVHAQAFDQLLELLVQREDYQQVQDALHEELHRTQGDSERQLTLQLSLARLQAHSLKQPELAVATLLPLLARDYPPEVVALLEEIWAQGIARPLLFRTLERAYSDVRDIDKLVALYQSTLEQDDLELQRECLTKLAQLERSELQRPEAAFSTLMTLLEREEGEARQIELMDELDSLAKGLNRYHDLGEHYEALIAQGTSTLALIKRTAHIFDRLAPDDTRAAYLYGFAFDREPNDLNSRDRLSAVLSRSQRYLELGEHLLRSAVVLEGETLEAESERYRLRLEAAQAFAKAPQAERQALQVLEDLLREMPPEHSLSESANRLAERLWLQLNDREQLHRHLRRWASQAPDQTIQNEVKTRLGTSLLALPEDALAGITELEEVLREDHQHTLAQEALWSFLRQEPFPSDDAFIQAAREAARLLEELYHDSFSPEAKRLLLLTQLRAQAPGSERLETLAAVIALELELNLQSEAFEHLIEALTLEPGSTTFETQLEALASPLHRWDVVAGTYEQLSANDSVELAAHYMLKVAQLSETHLSNLEAATHWYEQHLLQIPGSRPAVSALAAIYRKQNDAVAEARILQDWLDYSAQPEEISELRMRLGMLRMDFLDDSAGALDAFEGCLPERITDIDLMRRLERLYVKGAQFKALISLYEMARPHAQSKRETLELLAKSAQIYETRLNDLTSAREVARDILALEPTHRFALTSLERIERSRGDWEAVDEVLRMRFEAASDDEQRLKHLLDRAAVAHLERERPDEALVHLKAADQLVGPGPGHDTLLNAWQPLLRTEPAIRAEAAHALSLRYEAGQQWPQLINVLLLELIARPDDAARELLAQKLNEVLLHHGPAPEVALRILISGLRQVPQVHQLRQITYQRALALGELPNLLTAAEEVMRKGLKPEYLVAFAMWLGPIERQMGHLDRALQLYERVLDVEPAHAEAGLILGDLYRERRDWTALRGLYHQRLSVATDTERPLLHLELALLLSETEGPDATRKALVDLLSGPEGESLLPTLRERLGDLSSGTAACEALETHFTQRERWDLLFDLHLSRAELSTDFHERARRYTLASELAQTHLQQPEKALELLIRAALSTPHTLALWDQVERLAQAQGKMPRLREALHLALSLVDTQTQAELTLRLLPLEQAAAVSAETLQHLLENALILAPGHLGLSLALLEILKERRDLAGFAQILEQLASQREVSNEVLKAQWVTLRDLASQEEDLVHTIIACEAILSLDPRDQDNHHHFLEAYTRYERWEELDELLVVLVSMAETDAEAAELWTQVARLRASEAVSDPANAMLAWREVWMRNPSSTEAITALSLHFEARQDWLSLNDLLEDHARATSELHPELAAETWFKLGQVREQKLNQIDGAIEAYMQVRELAPQDARAFAALIPLFGRTRRFRELAETLSERAEFQADDFVEATKTHLSAAAVYLDHLNSPDTARHLVERILAQQPEHLEARVLLSRILIQDHHYAEAADLLRDLTQVATGRRQLQLMLDLARLYLQQLKTPEAAADLMQTAKALEATLFDETPPAKALRQRMHQLARDAFRQSKRYTELEAILLSEFGILTSAQEQGQLALQLAYLYHSDIPNPGQRQQYLDIARHLVPDSLEVLRLECDLAMEQEDYAQAEGLLQTLVQRLEAQHAGEELASAWHALGQVQNALSDFDAAIESFKKARVLDGKNVAIHLDYGKALVKRRRLEEALDAHRSLMLLRETISDEEERLGVLERLCWISWEMGQADFSRFYLNRLLTEKPDHAGGLALKQRFNS